MPITKKAVLITNPGESGAENYARGVYVDARNYQRFLASAQGGSWENSEIETMDRPTTAAVKLKVAELARYDYSFIMFSGHGWYSSIDKDRVLVLRENEEIASNELLRNSTRRVLIMDCCQVVDHESVTMRASEKMAAANESRTARAPNRAACRNLFSRQVEAAGSGIIRISSCGIDEKSWDDDNSGGRYNSSLLDCATEWANEETQKPVWTPDSSLSMVAAHDQATLVTRFKSNGTQNPSIEKAKTGPYFPFAVFAT
jgi:hypothetical protein